MNIACNLNNNSQINTHNIYSNNNPIINNKFYSIEEYSDLVINSVAYNLCPGLNHENFNFLNPKQLTVFNRNKDKHNHPENMELQPISNKKKYTLVLDMDETLIHFFDVS